MRISGTIEPAEIRFVIENPFLDGAPGRVYAQETLKYRRAIAVKPERLLFLAMLA
jgi:hypothetical protein